jgi:hypothetical protein
MLMADLSWSSMFRSSSTLFALVIVTACGAKDPGGSAGDDDPGVDAPGPTPGCSSATDCSAGTPLCDPNGVCVQCMSNADCSTDSPICNGSTCEASCAGEEVAANFVTIPSDIIWVVDQSGSMNQETSFVQTQINNFVGLIDQSGIDYRVVMIAATSGSNSICVPAPLGGASCGNNTQFRLVNQRIGSHDALAKAVSKYSSYSDFLRPEAQKHFVFVTDDNATGTTAATFNSGLDALLPAGMFTNRKVHGIYAFGNGTTGCTGNFGNGAAEGTQYTTLVTQTGGARGVICNDDWSQVFTDITAAVISGSQVSCDIAMPAAPAGQTIDPGKVNVKYLMGGVAPGVGLPNVATAADCTAAGGWYYDDNTTPTNITLCPTTCTDIQADSAANVKLELGCATGIF